MPLYDTDSQFRKEAIRPYPQPPAVGGANNGSSNGSSSSGGGSFSLPNSSVYLNETNAANKAYEDAKAQLLSQRNSLYHQYGLTDTGAVDVNNPYGDYQMLLGSEGAALDATHNDAISRGLGTGGLANRAEALLIPQQRAEQLGFQHQVDEVGQEYSQGLFQAEQAKEADYNQAYQDALQAALAQGLFDASPSSPSTTTTTTPSGTKTTVNTPSPAYKPYAVKVTANKTGASANKKQGIFSIH